MTRIARYWRAQPVYLTLLLLALLMRGLIPPGYMPAPGHGLFALELCTAEQYQSPGTKKARDGDALRGTSPGNTKDYRRKDATQADETLHREHALFGHSPLVDAGTHHTSSPPVDGTQQGNAPADQMPWANPSTPHHSSLALDAAQQHNGPHSHSPLADAAMGGYSALDSGPPLSAHQHDGAPATGQLSSVAAVDFHGLTDGDAHRNDLSPPAALAQHQHHQHHGATNPSGHESPCPFAASAVCAPAPVVLAHAVALDASPVRAIREPQVHTPSIVARSQNARAPPVLS